MTGLFDDFYLLASTWDTSSTEKMAQIEELKKRHGRKAATSIDTSMCKDHLKSRFLDAVYGLQKASLIKVTNNGKSFQKIVSTWVYDNLE